MMRLQKLLFLLGAASAFAAPHLGERADKITGTFGVLASIHASLNRFAALQIPKSCSSP